MESGEFYPREAKTAESRLRFFASHFDTVEIDSTYYAIPDQRSAWLWDLRTPGDFLFHIKVYGALTGHAVNPKTLPKDLRDLVSASNGPKTARIKDPDALKVIFDRFVDSLSPLIRARKIGLMLFQFPPWFVYGTPNIDYLLLCKEYMGGLRMAVEFRHGSWFTAGRLSGLLTLLSEHGITYVTADEPQFGNLSTIPFLPYLTTDTAYFRFHGRNRDNWHRKHIETSLRYAYRYSDQELREFIPPLKEADREAKTTFAMFNNCHRGYAVTNARRLKELLGTD